MTGSEQSNIQLLPRCDVCGVEYVEHYEGDCGEFVPSATDEQMVALDPSARCPGRVSWRATAELLYGRYAWLLWGRLRDRSLPLGCYATREVAIAAEELARAQPGADEWEDIWITSWRLETRPMVNFRMHLGVQEDRRS